jgi:putative membrane protein
VNMAFRLFGPKEKVVKGVEERTAGLMDYVFKAPRWKNTIPVMLILSLIVGAGVFPYGWRENLLAGLILIGLPAVLAAAFTHPLARLLRGTMTVNRSALLAFVGVIIVSIFCVVGALISFGEGWQLTISAYVMSLGAVFAFRILVLSAITTKSLVRNVVPASLQTVFGALFLPLFGVAGYAVNLLAVSLVFTVGALAFIRYMDAPLRRSFGVSAMDFLRDYIAQTTEGAPGMEDFFKKIGETVEVPVTTLSFVANQRLKATFVIPAVHPGPMGEIGGGNLPVRIAKNLDGGEVFVPHGTATHDFNLVSATESLKIVDAAARALKNTHYCSDASKSIRVQKGAIKLLAQRFGNSILFISTLSPESTEDIEYGLGLVASAEARTQGAEFSALIDAHNCAASFASSIWAGTRNSFDLIEAIREASTRLMRSELVERETKLGIATRGPILAREEGMGDLGTQVAVVDVAGHRTAYVLIDANNIVPNFRDVVVSALKVDEAEVMTTDNHVVNFSSSMNSLGIKTDSGVLLKMILELADEAEANLEPVSFGMNTQQASGVSVFGSKKTAQLASTVNAMMAMGGALAISLLIATVAISLLLVLFNP